MVGDLGKSLWLREIIDSVYREKRHLCHIILVKQNEKPTQYIRLTCLAKINKCVNICAGDSPEKLYIAYIIE